MRLCRPARLPDDSAAFKLLGPLTPTRLRRTPTRRLPLKFGMSDYFSDRERGMRPRVAEEVTTAAWGGIVVAIQTRIRDGSFGRHFPDVCDDWPNPPVGT